MPVNTRYPLYGTQLASRETQRYGVTTMNEATLRLHVPEPPGHEPNPPPTTPPGTEPGREIDLPPLGDPEEIREPHDTPPPDDAPEPDPDSTPPAVH